MRKLCAALAAAATTAAAAVALSSHPGAVAIPTAAGAPPTGPCALRGISDDVSEAAPTPAGFAHATGTVRALTLFIDFPDAPARLSPMSRFAEFFPAATDYFRTSSYGRLNYIPRPFFRWLRMSRPLEAYGITRGAEFDPASDSGYHALSREIVRAVDPYVDFRDYDVINVITTPNAGPPATRTVLSVTFSGADLGLKTGRGVPFTNVSFIWSRQTGLSAFRVINHENAHSFGLPDLYFTDDRDGPTPVGHWDPMDEDWGPTNDFLGWHKWKMGWLTPGQVHCAAAGGAPADHTLTPVSTPGGTKIVVIPTGPHSGFVVEGRTSGLLDPIVCRPGILIYHVATDVPSGHAPIRVIDATPHSRGCYTGTPNVDSDLTDATFRPGQTFRDHTSGVTVTVLTENTDGTYRVRVTPAHSRQLPPEPPVAHPFVPPPLPPRATPPPLKPPTLRPSLHRPPPHRPPPNRPRPLTPHPLTPRPLAPHHLPHPSSAAGRY